MNSKSTENKYRKPLGYNKRTEEQREYDILFCSKLFLRGYPYREIVAELNKDLAKRGASYTISLSMVYYDLKQCLIEWKRERLETIDDYITQELQKLDAIEVQAWEAWEASKEGKRRNKERINKGSNKSENFMDYEENATETSAGNPRFLDVLLNVQQRRAKMLGFDAPVKIEMPNKKSGIEDDAPKYDIKSLPDELLFAVADKLQAAEYENIISNKDI